MAYMKDVRGISFTGKLLKAESNSQRNPILRVLWKPDIATLLADNGEKVLDSYLERLSALLPVSPSSDLAYFSGAVQLITHKKGILNVLDVGEIGSNDISKDLSENASTYNNKAVIVPDKTRSVFPEAT